MTQQNLTTTPPTSRRTVLFTTWVFVMFLYIYGDILTLMDPMMLAQILAGEVDGIVISEKFLLAASVLMTLPISMVLLTQLTPYRIARISNIAIGLLKTAVVAATLFTPFTSYYLFMSCLEISTTLTIVWLAWSWRQDQA